jgi:NADH dehydrogenase FAD-containing subunit
MNPFTARVSSLLPNQVHKKAIEVDAHLRVKGAPLGDVYAIGDCATVSACTGTLGGSAIYLSIYTWLIDLYNFTDRDVDS